jgi:uncharacterized membrane protein
VNGALLDGLTAAAALGCGAVGGVFFTFSTFTMQGLARLPDTHGITAMQRINEAALRPAFMTLLFGTGAVCTALAVRGATAWDEKGSPLMVAGAALYLAGTLGVTVARNVPLNDALAAADPDHGHAPALWRSYLQRWTRWNHVRTASSIAAAGAYLLAALDRA